MPEQTSSETGLAKSNVQTIRVDKPSTSFAPRNLEEAITFCKFVANSDLAPKDYKGKPENVLIAIQIGAELGLAPMQSVQNIAVINGRGSLWGDALLALIQSSPAYEWHKEWFEGTGNSRVAVCQMKRRGNEVHEVRFSYADAAKADLLGKDTYKKYGDRMFQMRARGFCGRDKFADVLKGIISTEEAMDYPPDVPIQGGPLVEQSKPPVPDPLDAVISKEKANSLWEAKKANKKSNEDYRKALATIAGVDSSAKVTERHFDAMMKWATEPAEQPKQEPPKQETAAPAEQHVENPDAEPCEDGGQQ